MGLHLPSHTHVCYAWVGTGENVLQQEAVGFCLRCFWNRSGAACPEPRHVHHALVCAVKPQYSAVLYGSKVYGVQIAPPTAPVCMLLQPVMIVTNAARRLAWVGVSNHHLLRSHVMILCYICSACQARAAYTRTTASTQDTVLAPSVYGEPLAPCEAAAGRVALLKGLRPPAAAALPACMSTWGT